jgi:hypothetical protein
MYYGSMRTTIEIADDKLIKLKKLAAEGGQRGYSGLIDEALDKYLDRVALESPDERRAALRRLYGAWDDTTASRVRERIAELWRHPR